MAYITCYSQLSERVLTIVFLCMYGFPSHENLNGENRSGIKILRTVFSINEVITIA